MEQNLPVMAKRVWSIVRVAFFMLRKGISKKKVMVDINLMFKRGKIVGAAKAFGNLMFHHHHHNRAQDSYVSTRVGPTEYEFSCSNTPYFPFNFTKRKSASNRFFACAHAQPTEDDEVVTADAVNAVLEMLNNNKMMVEASPGFGRTPLARQLRVTDSPFPVRDADEDGGFVDKAAEEFIKKFYKDLKKENLIMV